MFCRSLILFFACLLVLSPIPTLTVYSHGSSLVESLFPRTVERIRERRRRDAVSERNADRARSNNFGFFQYEPRVVEVIDFSSLESRFASRFGSLVPDSDSDDLVHHASLDLSDSDSDSSTLSVSPTPPSAPSTLSFSARSDISSIVKSHYTSNPDFLWIGSDMRPTSTARLVERVLQDAHRYGLDSNDYLISSLVDSHDERSILSYEFGLTLRVLRYILDSRHGVVVPSKISFYHDYARESESIASTMSTLASIDNPVALMLDSHPKTSEFLLLKRELSDLGLSGIHNSVNGIDLSTVIRPGGDHNSLGIILARLENLSTDEIRNEYASVLSDISSNTVHYSVALSEFVMAVQSARGIAVDGVIGPRTLLEIFPRPALARTDLRRHKILYAMERLRWLPDNLGDRYVMINQPSFRVSLMSDDKVELSMRSIVGTRYNQTNLFYDEIEYVEFNPYWGVPRSIITHEFLPELLHDPSYLDNEGFALYRPSGEQVKSVDIDWHSFTEDDEILVIQPPGPTNALGNLKIMFPNEHAIYMHDTPTRNLFSRRQRDFSHGCVRLEFPNDMAAALLGMDVSDIESSIAAGKNVQVSLPNKVPVYLSYMTAWPDVNGKIQYYDDVYDRDNALSKALSLEHFSRQVQ